MAIVVRGATCSLGEAVVDKLLMMDVDVIASEESHRLRNRSLLDCSTVNLQSSGEGYSISFDGSSADLEIGNHIIIHDLIPGGAHTYSKGDDQFPINSPAAITHGKGPYVWDLDGNQYIDMSIGGIGATVLGYRDPDVDAAVCAVVAELGGEHAAVVPVALLRAVPVLDRPLVHGQVLLLLLRPIKLVPLGQSFGDLGVLAPVRHRVEVHDALPRDVHHRARPVARPVDRENDPVAAV